MAGAANESLAQREGTSGRLEQERLVKSWSWSQLHCGTERVDAVRGRRRVLFTSLSFEAIGAMP
jgi:hypothetical protein